MNKKISDLKDKAKQLRDEFKKIDKNQIKEYQKNSVKTIIL